ncbi:biotin/lipoyl-binding protein, partial [Desulfobacterales bacterium HSG2]|nr:biotin/lipoyl-binding protein [Desulfobacterales bacterium HSG2]
MKFGKTSRSFFNIITRIIICAVVLFIGVMGMRKLASMKKPPAEAKYQERPLQVEVLRAEPEDVPVSVSGFGEVKALDTVSIAAEVSGKIVKIHPRLELGEIIPKGDILFKVDPRDYDASVRQAQATVEQWKNTISRLRKQLATDKQRLKTLRRNRDLARAEFDRIRRLFKKGISTRSGSDAAERASNSAGDIADQMAQTVALYPIRIKEAESTLSAAKAALSIAKVRLERCEVRSPFNGRVKALSLEAGQYVAPGAGVVTLADDSVLEIHVPLDTRDARKWLRFNDEAVKTDSAWFSKLYPAQCKIRWTEDRNDHQWDGRLHRVIKFDPQTRTLTVGVRIEAKKALSDDPEKLPLVEGMFCSVEITGKTLNQVIRLPRWADSFE